MSWRQNVGGWGIPPHQYIFDATRGALVVIDVQYGTVHPDYGLCKILRDQAPDLAGHYLNRVTQVVVPNIQRLLAFFRERGLPVIYITLGSEREDGNDLLPRLRRRNRQFLDAVGVALFSARGQIDHQVIPEVAPQPGEIMINKTSYGAFNSTGLDQTLHNAGVTSLVFVGVATNICVETTARDAADRGYDCILVEDGCAAHDHAAHEATLVNFARSFGQVLTTDEVIEALHRGL